MGLARVNPANTAIRLLYDGAAMDTFDDVVIDPNHRISDDPSDWILPKSLVRTGDFQLWWDDLRATDDALHESGLTRPVRETLTWLVAEYMALQSEVQQDNHQMIPQHLSKVRTVVRHICHLGLSTEQTARLLGESRATVFRSLFFNKPIPDTELETRFRCESLLREKVPPFQITSLLPMSADEVRGLAKMLGIERATTHDGLGEAIRTEAVDLRRRGWTNPQIAEHLSDKHGVTVRPATVSQWWRRSKGAA